MTTSLLGIEAELAVSAHRDGEPVEVCEVAFAFIETARAALTHLRGGDGRLWLPSGGVLYMDHGAKIEIATPECTTPSEAITHLKSAERVIAKIAHRVARRHGYTQVRVTRCQVDYLDGVSTWGLHENYLTRHPLARYVDWVSPHLASRIILTGSGGLDPLSRGIRYMLSPRAAHIECAQSQRTTHGRGLFNVRDEPLSKGYGRLHVIAGNNCCSQLQMWLQVATTALVVALAEHKRARRPVDLTDVASAFRAFARDPAYRAPARSSARGIDLSALDIQYRYLEKIAHYAGSAILPDWAPYACRVWRATLDALTHPAQGIASALDWGIKRELFENELRRHGLDWRTASEQSDVLDGRTPTPSQLDTAAVARLVALRSRLCEIDVRFGEIGRGIFDSLDRQGRLTGHRIVDNKEIFGAWRHPPSGSRARLRGEWVQHAARATERYSCSWEAICCEDRLLDLSDPFTARAEWRPAPLEMSLDHAHPDDGANVTTTRENLDAGRHDTPGNRRYHAFQLFAARCYAQAEDVLRGLLAEGFEVASTHCHLARLYIASDRIEHARDHVDLAWAARASAPRSIFGRILWLRLALTLIDASNASEPPQASHGATTLIGQLKTLLHEAQCGLDWTMTPTLEYLEPRLPDASYRLLSAFVQALSRGGVSESLRAVTAYAQAPAAALDLG